MTEVSLSRIGRVYVLAVLATGAGLIVSSMLQVAAADIGTSWMVVVGLSLLCAPFSLRIPSMRATVTVTEAFVFASALLFGPPVATVIVAFDGLVLSLRAERRSVDRVGFNMAEPAISVWMSSHLFYVVSGVEPLAGRAVELTPLLLPLLLMIASYFLLNGVLSLTALWFETHVNLYEFLKQQLPHVAINYFTSCCCIVLLVLNLPDLSLEVLGMFVPLLVLTYASSKLSTARVEEANRHLGELSRLYLTTIEALALAIDAKDLVTSGHIRRVQSHSVAVARKLGVTDAREIKAIEASALLHDLGKLAIPEHVLNKPGKLTESEFEQMKSHAKIGADILSTIDFPYPVEPIVRHHHETWDGQGYPDGLVGDAIPLGARILSVVDCFDALTSDRPYRRAMDKEHALAVITARRGGHYDPRVVDVFVELIEDLLNPAVASAHHDCLVAAKEAEVPKVVAPEQAVRPTMLNDAVPMASHTHVGERRAHSGDLVLPNFVEVARYAESVMPGALCVVYHHQQELARLTVSHVSIPEYEFVLRDFCVPLGECLTGWVGANREIVYNSDPTLDFGDLAPAFTPRFRSCFSVPVIRDGELVGVLSVYGQEPQGLTRQRADDIVQLVDAGFTGRLQDPGVTQLKEVEDLPASTKKARSIAIVV